MRFCSVIREQAYDHMDIQLWDIISHPCSVKLEGWFQKDSTFKFNWTIVVVLDEWVIAHNVELLNEIIYLQKLS